MIRNFANNIRQFELAFEIPLRARCEVVLDLDVATACVHAAEIISEDGLIIDWYDTEQAQRILSFQNHSLDEYRAILGEKYRFFVPLTKVGGPAINMYFRSKSPYGSKKQH